MTLTKVTNLFNAIEHDEETVVNAYKVSNIDLPSKILTSHTQQTYLGKGIAIGDFNGDSRQEMFIGAPGYSANGNSE